LEKPSLHKTVITTHLSGGVRTIAFFEALKGMLVLAAGFGLLSLVQQDLQAAAERLVRLFHLNPAHHYPCRKAHGRRCCHDMSLNIAPSYCLSLSQKQDTQSQNKDRIS